MVAAIGLVIGAVLGMAGTFAGSASLRGLAWGLDGTALIVGAALLTVHHFRRGNEVAAAGFLVFVVGEGLIRQFGRTPEGPPEAGEEPDAAGANNPSDNS